MIREEVLSAETERDVSEMCTALLAELDEIGREICAIMVVERLELFEIDSELAIETNTGGSVTPVVDPKKARKLFRFAFQKYLLDKGQHPKRTYRLPGVAVVGPGAFELFKKLNEVKSNIEYLMIDSGIINARKRGTFFSNEVKSKVVLKELYRRIVLLDSPVNSISLTWGKSVKDRNVVSRDQVIASVEKKLNTKNCPSIHHLLEELVLLRALPVDVNLRMIRPIPPHPRANVVCQDGSVRLVHANLPLVLSSEHTRPSELVVTPLRGVDETQDRARRSDCQDEQYSELIPRLNLYIRR